MVLEVYLKHAKLILQQKPPQWSIEFVLQELKLQRKRTIKWIVLPTFIFCLDCWSKSCFGDENREYWNWCMMINKAHLKRIICTS
jgi:hypothetical protein